MTRELLKAKPEDPDLNSTIFQDYESWMQLLSMLRLSKMIFHFEQKTIF